MSAKTTLISFGSTGVKTISTTFLPDEAEFDVFKFAGEIGGDKHVSHGWTDGTTQSCVRESKDGAHGEILGDGSKIFSISEWDAGTSSYVEVLAGTINSFNATSLKINVTVAGATAANYQVRIKTRN